MKKFPKFGKYDIFPLTIILIVNFLLKIPLSSQGYFAFTYDQGRDLLVVARMIYEGKLTLIGPTTGLQGIFYGPTWYYFLAPLLYISGGNPQAVANFVGTFAILTIFAIYFLFKYQTSNTLLSTLLTLIASLSSYWMIAPILIWSPTLVTFFMVLLFFTVHKIFTKPRPFYFFILGALTILIGDGEAAFGVVMLVAMALLPLIFPRHFFKKQFLLAILGAFLAASPRIIFDLKHDFLITNSTISYFLQPKVYGENIPLISRFINILNMFLGIFSKSFAQNNKTVGILILITLATVTALFARQKKFLNAIKEDKLLHYCVFLTVTILVSFSIFPDTVWDYYLVGLPVIFLLTISRIVLKISKDKKYQYVSYIALLTMVVFNFNKGLLAQYKTAWLGDGSIYKNQKVVMDYIASEKPHDWSFHAYSPAIFDYPFEYLVYWYSRKGKIEAPKQTQKLMYLIVRDFPNKQYLKSGWYGDKTRDNTEVLYEKTFPGDLLLEKHLTND